MKNDKIYNYINEKYNNPKHLVHARIQQLLHTDFILKQCKQDLINNPLWKTEKNILLGYFYQISELLKCAICHNNISIESTLYAYKHNLINQDHYCSRKCQGIIYSQNKDKIQAKIKATNLARYGVENTFQTYENKEKIKATNLARYGVENPFQSEIIKEKIKQTTLKRYGVEHTTQANIVKEKIKNTNLQKYGVVAPLQNKDVLNKLKETNLQKYGCEYALQNKAIQEKSKQTCLKKYGVTHSSINPNRLNTLLNKSWNSVLTWKEHIIPLFTRNEWEGVQSDKIYQWKCVQCNTIFESDIHHSMSNFTKIKNCIGFKNIPRCPKCYPPCADFSNLEKELLDFCKQYFPNATNNRKLIYPYEIDIDIPEKKLAIEFNGLYWHDSKHKDKNYHLMKTKLCEKHGYQLIHVFEHEWLYKKDIIKQNLINLFQFSSLNYNKNCYIKEISAKEKQQFLEQNYLYGNDKSLIKLGLFYNNELISVMTFGKSYFNKKYEYELISYVEKNYIENGVNELLKYFEQKYQPKSLITYVDRCWPQENLYKKLNFIKINETEPAYFWVKNNQYYNQYQTKKSNLLKILGNKFNPDLTVSDNMFNAGFYQIFNCGNSIFIKNY